MLWVTLPVLADGQTEVKTTSLVQLDLKIKCGTAKLHCEQLLLKLHDKRKIVQAPNIKDPNVLYWVPNYVLIFLAHPVYFIKKDKEQKHCTVTRLKQWHSNKQTTGWPKSLHHTKQHPSYINYWQE